MLRRYNVLKHNKIKMQLFWRTCKNGGAKCQKSGGKWYFLTTKREKKQIKRCNVLNNKTLQNNNICNALKMNEINKTIVN